MTNQTPEFKVISQHENAIEGGFKPDRRFYSKIYLKPKRLASLLRDEKALYICEAVNWPLFFGLPIQGFCKKKENPATNANSTGK